MSKNIIVCGIDPGLTRCGIACVSSNNSIMELLKHDLIEGSIKNSNEITESLLNIYRFVLSYINEYKIDVIAIEKVFITNNHKTIRTVYMAVGVILLLLAEHNIPVYFYTPTQIKAAITGYGVCTKQLLSKYVQNILKSNVSFKSNDVSDAAGIALCHIMSSNRIK